MTTTSLQISTAWERPALTAGDGSAILMIRIAAPESRDNSRSQRPAVDLAFVIDRSGSMAGRPVELAKQAVSQAIGMLDGRDRATLVVFDDRIDLLHHLSPVDSRARNEPLPGAPSRAADRQRAEARASHAGDRGCPATAL